MPIDVRLLRSDDDASQVARWQSLRERVVATKIKDHSSNNNSKANDDGGGGSEETVRRVTQIDHDFRQAQKILNAYKSSCRQQRKRPDPQLLQSHQQGCDELAAALKESLCMIANAVDETLLMATEHAKSLELAGVSSQEEIGKETKSTGIFQSTYRRLIELGALEAIGDLSSNKNSTGQSSFLCWTGLGKDWIHALASCLASETIHLQPLQQVQILQLPTNMPLEMDVLHQMMGCVQRSEDCSICSNPPPDSCDTMRQAPSWLGFLKLQYSDQTLGDKQLPKVLSYSVRATNRQPLTGDAVSSHVLDPREQLRENSFPDSHLLSTQAGTEHDVHNLLMLTSSTYSDSRSAQQEWAARLLSFYQSLLPTNATTGARGDVVRQRVIAPPDLVPAEASRIVIEGYLPKVNTDGNRETTSSKDSGSWVILGYLSNFSDYPTRACRIKNNQQQFCHVIQGLLCSIPETMCWHACYSSIDDDTNKNVGIDLPSALAQHFPRRYPTPLVLPQIRSLEKTKHGRIQIRTIRPPKSDDMTAPAPPTLGPTEPSRLNFGNQENKQERKARVTLIEPYVTLSTDQIRCEALSSPHDFLPFYPS